MIKQINEKHYWFITRDLLLFLFTYFHSTRETKKESSCPLAHTSQGLSHWRQPRAPSGYPKWVAETQTTDPLLDASQGAHQQEKRLQAEELGLHCITSLRLAGPPSTAVTTSPYLDLKNVQNIIMYGKLDTYFFKKIRTETSQQLTIILTIHLHKMK